MNQKKVGGYIPVFTSEAGSCLTLANWQEIGISTASYYLDALLMKPGYSLLKTQRNLQSYCGWQETIVLNATLAAAKSDGIYTIRSRFDGSLLRIGSDELFSLIVGLQPDIVILPPGLLKQLDQLGQALPKSIQFFIPSNEWSSASSDLKLGSYLTYDKTQSFADFKQDIKQYAGMPIYLRADLSISQALELVEQGGVLLESDKPASDAMIGEVYSEQGTLALLDSQMANQQEPIDAHCSCPTCTQGFTRAYLHHLLMHTPLLCQRYLIQHNVYYYLSQYPLQ